MLRLVFLAAGSALLVYLIVDLGPDRVLEMLGRVGWHALAIAGIYALYQSMRAAALVASVSGPGRLGWAYALLIRLSGEAVQFLTFTGPFLAEPAKALLLRKQGLTTAQGFSATLAEYLTNSFVGAVFAVIGLIWLAMQDSLAGPVRIAVVIVALVPASFLVVGAIAIAQRSHLLGAILERAVKLKPIRARWRLDMAAVHRTEDVLLGILHDRPLRFIWILLIQCGSHALHFFELYWILLALDLETGLGTTFVIEGATKMVGLVFFFVPAQVGAAEGSYAVVFDVANLPLAAGFAVPFVRRLRMIALSLAGLLAMWVLMRRASPGG